MRIVALFFAPTRTLFWVLSGAIFIELSQLTFFGDVRVHKSYLFVEIQFLVCWWLAVTWGLWFIARAVYGVRCDVLRITMISILTILLSPAIIWYLVSWGVYFQTNEFANYESMRLLKSGFRFIFYITRQTSKTGYFVFWIIVGGTVIGLPLLLRWLSRVRYEPRGSKLNGIALISTWVVLIMAAYLACPDINVVTRAGLTHECYRFRTRLNPYVTLYYSWLDSARPEFKKDLDTTALAPIGKDWNVSRGRKPYLRPPILFLAFESLRYDMLFMKRNGKEVMPRLNELATSSVVFTRAYSASTHTDYAIPASLSSLYPIRTAEHHYYQKSDPWPKTLIYDILKNEGYATAIITSDNEVWGQQDNFLNTPGLDVFFDAARSDMHTTVASSDLGMAAAYRDGLLSGGTLPDNYTVDTALKYVGERIARNEPFFLHTFFQSTHFPYEVPDGAPKPFQPCELNFPNSFLQYPLDKADVVFNAYCNAAHYEDAQLGRLIDYLHDRSILDNCIIVLYGDHGEAFGEHNLVTHAREPIECVARIPLIVFAPKFRTAAHMDYPAHIVDLVPTVLGLCGYPRHPNFQGLDLFDAHIPEARSRMLPIHMITGMSIADAVIVGDWKLMRVYKTGRDYLFNVAADPNESNDLKDSNRAIMKDLSKRLENWRSRQVSYYHFPEYFTQFYPPAP